MPWSCPSCASVMVNAVDYCIYCKTRLHKTTPRPENFELICDEFDLDLAACYCYGLELVFWKYRQELSLTMTDREELFKKFFNEEKALVSSLSDLELRERIIELEKIATEAKIRLTTAGGEARERNTKSKQSKGILANVSSINIDSETINTLARREKMSKVDKNIEAMIKLGMSREDAEKLYKGSTVAELRHGKHESQEKKQTLAEAAALLNNLNKPAEEKKEEETKPKAKLNLSFLKK